jgi:purine-binding chemotaxis protein CheW
MTAHSSPSSSSSSRTPPSRIDWQQVRTRLAEAMEATQASIHLSPERARAVLEERARLLARVPPAPPAAGEVFQVVSFSLGDERYAIETRYVREVVRLRDYAPLPGAPAFVFGALNLRGEVLAVMDLRPFCGVPQRSPTDLARVLVLGSTRAEFGILTDATQEVIAIGREDVLEAPASVSGTAREYLLGVTSEALIVLDGAVLLRDGRLFIDQGDSE